MNTYLKSFFYLLIFSVLHFGYDLTKLNFLKPFCGVNESIFQHLKMAFWSYIFLGLTEVLSKKRKELLYSRLFSAVILPWITMIIWYIPFTILTKIQVPVIEILWSITATYFSAIITILIEKNIEILEISKEFKILILFLTFISAFLFVSYTYRLPYIDVFINPENL